MERAEPIPAENGRVTEAAERFLEVQCAARPWDDGCPRDAGNCRRSLNAELFGQPDIHRQQRYAYLRPLLQRIVGFVRAVVRGAALLGNQPGANPDAAADDSFSENSPPAWQVGVRAARSRLAAGWSGGERDHPGEQGRKPSPDHPRDSWHLHRIARTRLARTSRTARLLCAGWSAPAKRRDTRFPGPCAACRSPSQTKPRFRRRTL